MNDLKYHHQEAGVSWAAYPVPLLDNDNAQIICK